MENVCIISFLVMIFVVNMLFQAIGVQWTRILDCNIVPDIRPTRSSFKIDNILYNTVQDLF